MIQIGNKTYELIVDHKNGWNQEAFKNRYSEVLDRYDYIVGDWGYDQLRLRGFFRENHPKAHKDSTIAFFQDYLNEYCNFGCAYFVLHKITQKQLQAQQQATAQIEKEDKTRNHTQSQEESKEPEAVRRVVPLVPEEQET